MKRVMLGAAAVGCLLLCGATFPTSADWKYWGVSGNDAGKLDNFFEKNSVRYLPNHHVQVWTKGLDDAALANQKMTRAELDQAADRIAHYYFPEVAKTQKLTNDQIIGIVGLEAFANGGEIAPKIQVLWEADCDGDMERTLTIIVVNPGGNLQSSDHEGSWTHNPPESLAANLAKMVCK